MQYKNEFTTNMTVQIYGVIRSRYIQHSVLLLESDILFQHICAFDVNMSVAIRKKEGRLMTLLASRFPEKGLSEFGVCTAVSFQERPKVDKHLF